MRTRWIIALMLLLALLLPGASLAEASVFTVTPSNVDDTAAIKQAFADAIAAGPGSVVEFAAGDFYISDSILAMNFSGIVRGQGSAASVLHIVPGTPLPATVLSVFISQFWGRDWYWPVMLAFQFDNNVTPYRVDMLGLGFDVTEPGDTWDWVSPINSVEPVDYEGIDLSGPAQVSATWRDVRITGDKGPQYTLGYSLLDGIVLSNLTGTFEAADVTVETVFGQSLNGGMVVNSLVRVGGERPEDTVVFRDVLGGGVGNWAYTNTAIEVTNVRAYDLGAAAAIGMSLNNCTMRVWNVETWNAPGAAVSFGTGLPSTLLWEDNTIRSASAGLAVDDSGASAHSQVVIRNNRLEGLGEMATPIFTAAAQGAVITNNRITGTGAAAMALGPTGTADIGMLIKGNNLQQWQGRVGIWLGAGSSGNTVVGGGKDLVLDEGTDNVVTGVNSAGGAIGDAVREAMQTSREIRSLWR
jgi:hypothetical protein